MNNRKLSTLYENKIIISAITLVFMLYTSCYLGTNADIIFFIKLLCLATSIFIVFTFLLTLKFNKFNLSLILFFITLTLSTYISPEGDVVACIEKFLPILSLTLYLEKCLKFNSKNCVLALDKTFFILVLINFITIVLYPKGLYKDNLYSTNWFLKYDNMHSFIYFPAILISYLATKYNKKSKITFILNLVMITYCIYYCFSANTVATYSLFLIYLVFNKTINKIEILNSKNYLIAYIVLFFSMIIFRIQEAFKWLIVDILKKDLTFTGRVFIWDKAIYYIKNKFIIGYGIEKGNTMAMKLGSQYFTHAHNTFLDVLYKSGLIGFGFFLYLIINSVKKLYKYKEYAEAKFVSFILLCIFIMTVFEAREDKIGLYIILLLGFYIDSIVESIKEKTNNKKEGFII